MASEYSVRLEFSNNFSLNLSFILYFFNNYTLELGRLSKYSHLARSPLAADLTRSSSTFNEINVSALKCKKLN